MKLEILSVASNSAFEKFRLLKYKLIFVYLLIRIQRNSKKIQCQKRVFFLPNFQDEPQDLGKRKYEQMYLKTHKIWAKKERESVISFFQHLF